MLQLDAIGAQPDDGAEATGLPALFELDDDDEEEQQVAQGENAPPRKGKFGKLGKAGGKLKRKIRSAKERVTGIRSRSSATAKSVGKQPAADVETRSRSRSGGGDGQGIGEPSATQRTPEHFDALVSKISSAEQELQDAIRLQDFGRVIELESKLTVLREEYEDGMNEHEQLQNEARRCAHR